MEHKSKILSFNAEAIKRLIEDNSLDQALDMLDESIEALGGGYWKEIVMLKNQYRRVRSAQISGRLSFSEISAEEQKVAWNILCLVEELSRKLTRI